MKLNYFLIDFFIHKSYIHRQILGECATRQVIKSSQPYLLKLDYQVETRSIPRTLYILQNISSNHTATQPYACFRDVWEVHSQWLVPCSGDCVTSDDRTKMGKKDLFSRVRAQWSRQSRNWSLKFNPELPLPCTDGLTIAIDAIVNLGIVTDPG